MIAPLYYICIIHTYAETISFQRCYILIVQAPLIPAIVSTRRTAVATQNRETARCFKRGLLAGKLFYEPLLYLGYVPKVGVV